MFCCVCGGSDRDEHNQLLQCNRFLLKVHTIVDVWLAHFHCANIVLELLSLHDLQFSRKFWYFQIRGKHLKHFRIASDYS